MDRDIDDEDSERALREVEISSEAMEENDKLSFTDLDRVENDDGVSKSLPNLSPPPSE